MQKYSLFFRFLIVTVGFLFGSTVSLAKNNAAIPSELLKGSLIKKACDIKHVTSENKVRFVASLDRKAKLYKIFCTSGAYNREEVFYVVKQHKRKPILQHFFEYSAKGKRSRVKSLVNAAYDKKHKILSSYHKYSGLGNCGHSGRYKWIGTGFKLVKFSLQDECIFKKKSHPWPVIYPKKR